MATRPEVRINKLGHAVTKHVRVDEGKSSDSLNTLPKVAMGSPARVQEVEAVIEWLGVTYLPHKREVKKRLLALSDERFADYKKMLDGIAETEADEGPYKGFCEHLTQIGDDAIFE